LDEATPTEAQNKNVLPVLSDVGVGFSVASTELSSSVSSSVTVQSSNVTEQAKSGEDLLVVVTKAADAEIGIPVPCVELEMKEQKPVPEVKTEQPSVVGITAFAY
jgi:hypothetical protein